MQKKLINTTRADSVGWSTIASVCTRIPIKIIIIRVPTISIDKMCDQKTSTYPLRVQGSDCLHRYTLYTYTLYNNGKNRKNLVDSV